jgi:hypothetical protein
MDNKEKVRHAMTEFLLEVNTRTPPYWYSVFGEGPGSRSYFFGMKEDIFIEVLVAAEVLKQHGDTLCFQREKFYAGFNLLVGGQPKSIEAEQSKLDDPNIKITLSTKGQRKVQWFIRVGSSTASRSYQPLDPRLRKVESQVKAGLPPPQVSLNLSRRLFKECESIRNILLAKEPNLDAQKSAAHHEDFAAKPKDAPEQSMAAPRPTPILPSVEEEEVMNTSSDTPFLDEFVGERDKEDETKLMGAVKEALGWLVWCRGDTIDRS